jgi:tetratricopeptide (TPR) repeat protein
LIFFNKIFIIVSIIIFGAGCAQKVNVRFLEPAEIDRAANTKKITVVKFQNDRMGLSQKIESKLSNCRIDGKNYFTIVSRKDFDKIIAEQKIQNSGILESQTMVEVGELIDAQAIISGSVKNMTSKNSFFYEKRSRCVDKKCKQIEKYLVRCRKVAYGLLADMRMVDVEKGDIIYADVLSSSQTYKHCEDYTSAIPSRGYVAEYLAQRIANRFTNKLIPHYRYSEVVLLEDGDLDYSDEQEKLLEVSLLYAKKGRYDKAQKYLIELIDSTGQKSYVAFYNLGVIKEAQGKYIEAQHYYKQADALIFEPIEEIDLATSRIQKLIDKQSKVRKQLQR